MISFEEVRIGDQAPELTHQLSRTDLVRYAGASGDFNPMHHDEIKAKAAGLPSVFGHGMFSAGFLATAVTNWVGIGNLKSYKVRFVKQTWPSETFVTRITVKEKQVKDGEKIVLLTCELTNQDGEVKVSGEALASVNN